MMDNKTVLRLLRSDNEFQYMLLGRMKADCDYFLGNGNRCSKHLWANNVSDHIEYMKLLYNVLPVKPEWITIEQINEYKKAMEG